MDQFIYWANLFLYLSLMLVVSVLDIGYQILKYYQPTPELLIPVFLMRKDISFEVTCKSLQRIKCAENNYMLCHLAARCPYMLDTVSVCQRSWAKYANLTSILKWIHLSYSNKHCNSESHLICSRRTCISEAVYPEDACTGVPWWQAGWCELDKRHRQGASVLTALLDAEAKWYVVF